MKPTCIVCLALIEEDDPIRTNARGGVMHAECDPIRCPHCDEVIDR